MNNFLQIVQDSWLQISLFFNFFFGLLLLFFNHKNRKKLEQYRANLQRENNSEIEKIRQSHVIELENLKNNHTIQLEDIKKKHLLEIDSEKIKYQNKVNIYKKYYNQLDEFSKKSRGEMLITVPVLQEDFLKVIISSKDPQEIANAFAVNIKKLIQQVNEASEEIIVLRNEINELKMFAGDKLVALIEELQTNLTQVHSVYIDFLQKVFTPEWIANPDFPLIDDCKSKIELMGTEASRLYKEILKEIRRELKS